MKRRSILASIGGLLTLSGCLSAFEEGSSGEDAVGIVLENNSLEEKTVEIRVTEDETTALAETYSVPSDARVKKDKLLDAGSYKVTVSIEGIGERSENWDMSGCQENDILITFKSDILIDETCHND